MTKQINVEDRPGRLPRGWLPAQKANFSGEIVSADGADRQQRHPDA